MGAAFGNPLGTAAATDILHQGGSAIDAVRCGFLLLLFSCLMILFAM